MTNTVGTPVCPIFGSKPEQVVHFTYKNGHTIYRCCDCGLLFVHPIPEDVHDVYEQEYFTNTSGTHDFGYADYERDKIPMRSAFERLLDVIDSHTTGKHIFDIGAATGYFLDIAREQGWQTAGVEISLYAATIAQKKGHAVSLGSIDEMQVGSPSVYDAITLWDVLEHVKHPRIVMKTVNQLLKKGGIVAINTPDVDSVCARVIGKWWYMLIPPEHLHYFSRTTLSRLLEEEGFEVLSTLRIRKRFSLSYIFEILYHWQKVPLWQNLSRYCSTGWLSKIEVPLNLRDNICVLARKVYDM